MGYGNRVIMKQSEYLISKQRNKLDSHHNKWKAVI